MEEKFNSGFLTVTDQTISFRRLLGNTHTIQRNRITAINYRFDNIFYKVLRFPLGILYICLVATAPVGFRFLRGDVVAVVNLINGESYSFWVYGTDIKRFKQLI